MNEQLEYERQELLLMNMQLEYDEMQLEKQMTKKT